MNVRTSKNSGEVSATYNVDEWSMEMVMRLPSDFPFRQVEVEGGKRIGVSGKVFFNEYLVFLHEENKTAMNN